MANPLFAPQSALANLFPSFASLFSRRGPAPAVPANGTPATRTVSKVVRLLSTPVPGFGGRKPLSLPVQIDPTQVEAGSSLMGSSVTSSPSLSAFQRLQQVYDRRAIIRDLWELYYGNPILERGVWKRARAAVGQGFDFKADPRPGVSPRQAKRAQEEIDALLRRVGVTNVDGSTNTEELAAWVVQALMTGDLFQQRVFQKDSDGVLRITSLVTMPSESMERLTDNADQFFDPARAFQQVDVQTQSLVMNPDGTPAVFHLAQVYHGRWKRTGAERYGNPDFVAGRASLRELSNLEYSHQNRRLSHGGQMDVHSVGDATNPSEWSDVEKYRQENGYTDAQGFEIADPTRSQNAIFHNGRVDFKRHDGDPNIGIVNDLEYFREDAALAIDVPLPLLGLGSKDTTRDTLQFWLTTFNAGREPEARFVWQALWAAIVTQLLLVGINPASLNLSLTPRRTGLDTPMDRANFIKTLSQNTIGAGMSAKPFPLGTPEQWMAILAEDLGITDPRQAVEEVKKMLKEQHMDADTLHDMAQASVTNGGAVGTQNGSANSKNAPGGAKTGYGKKFDGAKRKDSTKKSGGEGYQK